MADDLQRPHDKLVQSVLGDLASATSFLQLHLPESLTQALNWATLRLDNTTFVDDAMQDRESDCLYQVEHVSDEQRVFIYVLIEHQSRVDTWMRLRLLKYCCRIWERQLGRTPSPRRLQAIVPLVFYQGERRWTPSTEFADLFADSVRDWPWIPHFRHELLDQSGLPVEAVQGEVKVQIMALLMLAAYHPAEGWMERVAALWGLLAEVTPSGGVNYVERFVRYILSTQDREVASQFGEVLRRYSEGDDVRSYAQELLEEGEAKGRAEGRAEGALQTQVEMVENLIREGASWSLIERAIGVNEAQFEVLKARVQQLDA